LLISEFKDATSIEDRTHLITFLFDVACSDGSLADEELSFIHQLSKDFEIAELSFLKVLGKYKMWNKTFRAKELDKLNASINNELQNKRFRALTILGLLPNASDIDIKKRYRNLMKKHHPDANPHLTVKEMVYHKKQMFKINEAYAFLLG
jgi:DnaJ like chaperone protein